MSKLILVTGGARSGKSNFAELLAAYPKKPVTYIATAQVYDDEMALRVKKHQEQRPADWSLVEEPLNVPEVLENLRDYDGVILLDCVTLWLTNLLLASYPETTPEGTLKDPFDYELTEKNILKKVHQAGSLAQEIKPQVIMVTNEVGQGIVPGEPLSRAYRDLAGRANRVIATAAQKVYWVVAGYPIEIKETGQALIQSLESKVDE